MQISPDAVEVRAIVRRTFLDLGVHHCALAGLSETLLIDEGRCCARSYRVENYMAMWLIDVGLLQFYDGEGNMIRHANLLAELEPRRMAA